MAAAGHAPVEPNAAAAVAVVAAEAEGDEADSEAGRGDGAKEGAIGSMEKSGGGRFGMVGKAGMAIVAGATGAAAAEGNAEPKRD